MPNADSKLRRYRRRLAGSGSLLHRIVRHKATWQRRQVVQAQHHSRKKPAPHWPHRKHAWPVRLFHHTFAINKHHLTLRRRVYVRARSFLIIGCLVGLGYHILTTAAGQSPAASASVSNIVQATPANHALYPDLPSAVANAISSVVAVQRLTGARNRGLAASGVIVSKTQVLTAGHEIDNGSQHLACANTFVQAPGLYTPAAASTLPVTRAALKHNSSIDLAVLSVQGDANFQSLPAMKLAADVPTPGSSVFFVNYQPKADGQMRSPTGSGANYPAVFSGTFLGVTPKGFAIATGAGKSYGHGDAEVLLRKGASGGAIMNNYGELIGLSVSSDSLEANHSAASLRRTYGVSLKDANYQLAYIQTMDTGVLTGLQSNLSPCK